jgi:hypothetical protein
MGGRVHELVGLSGQQRRWMSLSDLVATSHHAGVGIGSVDLVNLPIGPEETLACVAFGLYLIEARETKLVALLRAADEQSGQEEVRLEVLCRDRDAALAMLAELRRLIAEHNVFRGQMISFGESRMGHVTLGPIVFHRRPEIARDALVLPDGLLERVERQVFGIAEQRERLRAGGQHVRRGLLLHGPRALGRRSRFGTLPVEPESTPSSSSRAAASAWCDPHVRSPGCCSPRSWCSRTST